MADKTIGQLQAASQVTPTDLFVLEQSGVAKKLTGQTLENWLLTFADGHGGIQSIAKTSTSGLTDTYTITLSDNTTVTFTVRNGKGISSVTTYYAVSTSGSTVPSSWSTTRQTMTATNKYLWSYQHIAFNDNTSVDTVKTVIGVYGDKGDKGNTGDTGNGISSLAQTGRVAGEYTIYTFTMTNGTTQSFNAYDGVGISSINTYYAVSADGTTPPTSWSESRQNMTATNRYLWSYQEIHLSDNTTISTQQIVIGVYGDKGDKGDPGEVTQAEFDELDGEVDNLQSALEFANVTSMSSSERKLGRLVSNTGLWAYGTNSSHAIINTTSQNIEITASSNGNSFIAALRSYNFEDGQSADFSTVTGWTSVVSIPTGNTVKIAMPSDATCLYVLCVTTGNDRVPSSIIIDGYDVTQSALKNIGNIYNDATSYYDKVRLAMQEQNLRVGYLDGTSGQWKTSSSTRHSIIPVIAGQQIDVMAPYYPTLVIALLKTVNYKSSTVANFSAETGFTAPITLTGGMRKTFTVPSDANYMYILRLIGGADRTPAFLRIDGYDCLHGLDTIVSDNQKSSLLHLRLMEYNVGGYNYGTHIEPTLAQCAEKFPNYKDLYAEYHPDVLFVTEFAETAGPGPDETGEPIDVNEELYNSPFPYSWEGESTKGAVLKSKFPFFYTNEYQLSYSEDAFSTTTRYRLGRSFVDGKIITLVSIHIPVGHTQQYMNARRYFITQIIDKVKDDDYAIIAGDTNLGGVKTSESSLAELQDTIDYLHSVGWEACNGGYLPPQKTNAITYIDNVFYKNNGKIVFGNFHALDDWYDRLASDHYPVYADLVLI